MKIGFVGAGNMATSLIGGLIADGMKADDFYLVDTNAQQLATLQQKYGTHSAVLDADFINTIDVMLLAIKPQVMHEACAQVMAAGGSNMPLVMSVAAGLPTDKLASWLWDGVAIVRTMPNTPALIQAGATGLYANARVEQNGRDQAERIMRAVGLTVWLDDESQMDLVTALSGSGPAYFFLFMESLQKAAESLGLPAETARILTLQTALGASKLAISSDNELDELRKKVTSPGGTTERAVDVFMQRDIQSIFTEAMAAAVQRAQQMAKEIN